MPRYLETHDLLMPPHRGTASADLEAHARIQHVRLAPFMELLDPLLALQRFGSVVRILEIFLQPRHRGYLVVRAW